MPDTAPSNESPIASSAASSPRFGTEVLDRIFRARKVAVVGASPERGGPRNSILRVLLQTGYPGAIYPVHPRHEQVEGLRCWPDLESLPEVPDAALILTPSHTVSGVVETCGKIGVPAAVVFSSGFEEIEEGRPLAAELRETADRCGVALLGANCQGVWSVREKALLTFGAAALEMTEVRHAPVAVVSQSGALAGAIARYLQTTEIGCSYIVSVGNETQLDILHYLDWVVRQDDVRVVAVYIEGLNDGARLLPIAERARARGVQIVALKSGNSELGQSATASHTGKIASPASIYAHVLDQAGVIWVESLGEMLAAIETLAFLPDPRVSGDPLGGVSVLSISGGACALLADHCDQHGVPMAEFSPDVARGLEELFPVFGRPANPADMTAQVRSQPNLLDDGLELMTGDLRTEAFVMQFASSGQRDLREKGFLFKDAARERNLPVILSFAGDLPPPEDRRHYWENGVLFCQDPAATIRSLRWLYLRRRYAARPAVGTRSALPARPAPKGWEETISALAGCGIGAPGWRILGPGDAASETCRGLAWPLAVKALPEDAGHKTELGLVKLGVGSAEEVDAHAAEFRGILGNPAVGVLVQEMVSGGVEAVLSALRNTDFGPVMTLGLGGVGIELFRDVAHLALPATPEEVRDAIGKLRLRVLLEGFRGAPEADIDALVDAAVGFGDMFLSMPEAAELEINPLMVMPAGHGVVALDALVSLQKG